MMRIDWFTAVWAVVIFLTAMLSPQYLPAPVQSFLNLGMIGLTVWLVGRIVRQDMPVREEDLPEGKYLYFHEWGCAVNPNIGNQLERVAVLYLFRQEDEKFFLSCLKSFPPNRNKHYYFIKEGDPDDETGTLYLTKWEERNSEA